MGPHQRGEGGDCVVPRGTVGCKVDGALNDLDEGARFVNRDGVDEEPIPLAGWRTIVETNSISASNTDRREAGGSLGDGAEFFEEANDLLSGSERRHQGAASCGVPHGLSFEKVATSDGFLENFRVTRNDEQDLENETTENVEFRDATGRDDGD